MLEKGTWRPRLEVVQFINMEKDMKSLEVYTTGVNTKQEDGVPLNKDLNHDCKESKNNCHLLSSYYVTTICYVIGI